MRSQDTRPDPGLASDIAGTVGEDFAHLLSCWPRNHLNGETRHVARWCGWSYEEALARMSRLVQAGAIRGGDRWQSPTDGAWIVLWPAPAGAHGFPPVEGEHAVVLRDIGIYRAVRDDDERVLRYQGEPEFVVRRRAQRQGLDVHEAFGGCRISCEGPCPTHPHQLGFGGAW